MTKETVQVRVRAFTLARGRELVVFGRRIGKTEEVFTLVECPFCWALTMPEKAVAHAEQHS